jgi:hypothetical protein
MPALTTERLSPQFAGSSGPSPAKLFLPVKGSTKIYAGSLVVLNAGYAAPATAALGLVAVGKALTTADNSTGADGDQSIEIQVGVFRFENSSAGDAIAQANVGSYCFLVDDQTVALTSNAGARSMAGQVVQIDASGVWVLVGLSNVELLNVAALKQAQYIKVAADGAAATATTETAFNRVSRTGTIVGAWFAPLAALTGDATNNATLTLAKRDGAGGGASTVAAITTTAVAGNWTAFVPVSLGTLSNTSVAAGNVLTFAIAKGGTGVVVPAGTLIVAIAPA